jgi:hypothetical protein
MSRQLPECEFEICGRVYSGWEHDPRRCLAKQAAKVPDLLRRIERLERLTASESTTAGCIEQSLEDADTAILK